jgi:uncharacterized membrane protein required for colicin V production
MFIDVVVGMLVLYTCWRAFRQGFARQSIQLAGLGLGVCLAEPAAVKLKPWAAKHIQQVPEPLHGAMLALGAAFLVWLVVSVIGSFMLASYRRRIYGENVPSFGDNVFGIGIGAMKAAFLVSLIVFGFDRLPEPLRKMGPVEEQIQQSKSVAVSRDFNLVDRLIEVQEVQSIGKRIEEVVEYFKKPADPAKPTGEPLKDTPKLSGLEEAPKL